MALLVGGVSIVLYTFFASNSSSHNLDIATRNIKISQAILGEFEDSLSVRGTVRPKTTIYLDAVVGGRVEEKLVEEGQYVEQGQPLVRLSNASLQLDVISREAQISEQLNSLRNAQMQAETTRFDLRRNLMETENQIAHLERKIGQTKQLVDLGLVPLADLQELQQELKYYREGQQLALDRQEEENKIRALQLEQLKESAVKLKENLDFARANLENLVARAPRSGSLTWARGRAAPAPRRTSDSRSAWCARSLRLWMSTTSTRFPLACPPRSASTDACWKPPSARSTAV